MLALLPSVLPPLLLALGGADPAAGEAARHWLWDGRVVPDMFTPALPLLEKMVRPVLVYFFLVIALRVFGKRELTNINPFDFVVLLTLSNTVQNAIIGEDNSVSGGIVGALTLMAINYLVVRFIFRHRRLDQLIEGSPTKLIENGCVCKGGLAKEMLTERELLTVAHRQGFDTLDEVETCVLEPGGNFFVKGKAPSTDERRYAELLRRQDELRERLDRVLEELARARPR